MVYSRYDTLTHRPSRCDQGPVSDVGQNAPRRVDRAEDCGPDAADHGTQPVKECGPGPRGAHAGPPAPTSRSTPCASLRSLRPSLRRTFTSKPAPLLSAHAWALSGRRPPARAHGQPLPARPLQAVVGRVLRGIPQDRLGRTHSVNSMLST